jgi:hypothetical protein
MGALGVIMAAVAVLVSAPTDGAAQTDLSGMWTLTLQSDQGDQPLPITIVQDGEGLTASGEVPEFGPIEMKGTLDGSDVLFEWDLYIEGMELSIVFTGTIAEDGTISGTADFGGFGEGGWSAKRVED